VQATTRNAARANDYLFDSKMSAYIAASLHHLEAIPPICHLENYLTGGQLWQILTMAIMVDISSLAQLIQKLQI